MADKIVGTNINSLYNQLNNLRTGVHNPLPALTTNNPIPISSKAVRSNLNILINELNSMSTDQYYSANGVLGKAVYTHSSGLPVSGQKMYMDHLQGIKNTLNSVQSVIVCRNIASNVYTKESFGYDGHTPQGFTSPSAGGWSQHVN